MFGALKRGFRSMASLILVRNVVGVLQPKRILAASRGFLAAARLSCSFSRRNRFSVDHMHIKIFHCFPISSLLPLCIALFVTDSDCVCYYVGSRAKIYRLNEFIANTVHCTTLFLKICLLFRARRSNIKVIYRCIKLSLFSHAAMYGMILSLCMYI